MEFLERVKLGLVRFLDYLWVYLCVSPLNIIEFIFLNILRKKFEEYE